MIYSLLNYGVPLGPSDFHYQSSRHAKTRKYENTKLRKYEDENTKLRKHEYKNTKYFQFKQMKQLIKN